MHTLPRVPKSEIEQRIHRLQSYLQEHGIDGVLLAQNVDLYYFTGTMQNALCYIPREGEPVLYVKKSVARAEFEAHVEVQPLGRLRELGAVLTKRYGVIHKMGFELDVLPYTTAHFYQKLFSEAEMVDVSFALRHIRSVKSAYELAQIKRAAQILDDTLTKVSSWIRIGMSELELAARIEYEFRLQGNINLWRMRGFNQELALGMVASGSSASTPTYFDGPAGGLGVSTASPQGASFRQIKANEPILIDVSMIVEGYMVDQTRIAVIGELSEPIKEAYEVARSILRRVEEQGKPGACWQDLYATSLEMAKEAGLSNYFMGYGADQAKFLGHGVGIELDELPILAKGFSQPLEEGMVIAIEPKFTFPEQGVIGIENTYVVTANGLESLSVTSEEIMKIKL
ncbi:Xaa-Pro peptidase family protein [Thermoactinomyces sp. DSM 45892]|uniref:M24 family metallopeptidase n=1 Tax=Thermoactinomyces sp. DSM 45892 TaxID=1882753 RepID=UPI00089B9DC7|nr:Xaa-Pro peptidase family protein [Thermoactinomyces sp. DSM 45892]SDY75598.1 Xaa-Pro aminopeptidase [Thermoactinomyces sp. DSM 45892]